MVLAARSTQSEQDSQGQSHGLFREPTRGRRQAGSEPGAVPERFKGGPGGVGDGGEDWRQDAGVDDWMALGGKPVGLAPGCIDSRAATFSAPQWYRRGGSWIWRSGHLSR